MLLTFVVVGLAVAILWDYLFKKRRNDIYQKQGLKGPPYLPLIGCALHFARETPETIFGTLDKFTIRYGKTWYMWMLHETGIVTSDAKMLEAILSSQEVITKNSIYKMLHFWLGDGLLLSTGTKWHARRKVITPTFHFKILEQFVEVFDQQSAVMMQKLKPLADGKTVVNIFPIVCLTALDIIAETAMGVKVNAQLEPNFPYVQAVRTVSGIVAQRTLKPIYRFDCVMRLVAPRLFKQLQNGIKLMHDFTNKVIVERRETLEKHNKSANTAQEDDVGAKKRMAFLDVLLQSTIKGQPLSDADIREEVDTFMFEGHDTTTSGISFICYLISRHPEVQRKLFQEIRDVIGDDQSRSVSMRELQELKYLECVIKEGLRLYPPVPMIGRFVENDVELNGLLLPANSNITVLIFRALRDPDYFPKPDDFIPERFSAESGEKIDPFAYVPFSAGPRNCIGQKFAMLEMKSTISKLLRHYELLPLGEPIHLFNSLVLRSTTGVNVGLKPRAY